MFPLFSYLHLLLFLCLSRPCLSSRIAPGSVTVITNDGDSRPGYATWGDFTRFRDAVKGGRVIGISELKSYFHRFGYLTISNFTDVFDADLESAVTLYQKNLGLPVTGKLDDGTISVIMSPRCGVSDSLITVGRGSRGGGGGGLHETKHYAYFNGQPRWSRATPVMLTYAFSTNNMIHYLSSEEIKAVFHRAFSRWAAVIPVNFTEVKEYERGDIKIGFFRGDHGDGEPFDGVLGVLAHAFSPENGRFHLDAAETWAVDFEKEKSKTAVDLESVATHEIGHVLGLAHTSVKEAVMYPSLSPRTKKTELRIDDVEGVQALYGSNPNFKFSSLMESENSSNKGTALTSRPVSRSLTISLLVLFSLFDITFTGQILFIFLKTFTGVAHRFNFNGSSIK